MESIYSHPHRDRRRKLWEIRLFLVSWRQSCRRAMGLEGVVKSAMSMNMDIAEDLMSMVPPMKTSLPGLTKEALGLTGDVLIGLTDLHLDAENPESMSVEEKLLMQAQVLLKKSELYQNIEECLQSSNIFQPNVYNNLLIPSEDEDQVTSLHRDTAVSNLRFLNIFYGYNPKTFALAENLLDRLLGKVKAHPKYLSCIATCCFYIAIRTVETHNMFIPSATELIKLSQCGGTSSDLNRMERLILEKLQWQLNAVTPLTFLQMFYDVLGIESHRLEQSALSSLVGKLEVLMCQFEFTKFRAETLALGLLSHWLEDNGLLSNMKQVTPILELQYYCQISDGEFMHCRAMVSDYLTKYVTQRSKLPRLNLQWTVSRRTLTKLKPSTRCILDLEPIMEDEDDPDSCYDAGPFDSENDDSELQRALHKKYYQSLAAMQNLDIEPDDSYKKCNLCPPTSGHVVYDLNQNNNELALLPQKASSSDFAVERSDAHHNNDMKNHDEDTRNPQMM